MKVCELAINNLDQSIFPRLLYLRARSAYLSLHYSEATVLYNQLIKLCPKIPEYRLQRAMLFEQTGMYDFARQDFVEYSKLVPLWKDQFKEQVLLEKDPLRKQHLLDCLAKLKGYTWKNCLFVFLLSVIMHIFRPKNSQAGRLFAGLGLNPFKPVSKQAFYSTWRLMHAVMHVPQPNPLCFQSQHLGVPQNCTDCFS